MAHVYGGGVELGLGDSKADQTKKDKVAVTLRVLHTPFENKSTSI